MHLLRGMQSSALLGLLEVTEPDGTVVNAVTYLAANDDVTIEFQLSFENTPDAGATTSTGFGITINNETGEIRVVPPPAPDPVIHNFLVHATAQDSSDDKEYRISIRVHLHNRVTSAWLTPPLLTLRPEAGELCRRPPACDSACERSSMTEPSAISRIVQISSGVRRQMLTAPGGSLSRRETGRALPRCKSRRFCRWTCKIRYQLHHRNQSHRAHTFRGGLGVGQQNPH